MIFTPSELAVDIAQRARARRLAMGLRQQDVAERSGVSLASVRRFERTGLIAFDSLLKVAVVLDALGGFDALFPKLPFRSIDEVVATRPTRQRGRRS